MRTRRFILLVIAGVVLVGVFAFLGFREREPEYGGKRLSEWVEDLTSKDWHDNLAVVERAIHEMGVSNALPYLLTWMVYETPPGQLKFYETVNPILGRVKRSWQFAVAPTRAEQRAIGATRALVKLGPESERDWRAAAPDAAAKQ